MQNLNQLIDRFIKMENLEQAIVPHCAHQPEQLIDHPLLSYGYHTYSHFRLSSLSDSDQREDLIKGYRALNRLESCPVKIGRASCRERVYIDRVKRAMYNKRSS